jgi:DNA modification methylase
MLDKTIAPAVVLLLGSSPEIIYRSQPQARQNMKKTRDAAFDRFVADRFKDHTYKEVAEAAAAHWNRPCSVGKVYESVCYSGLRRNESRIRSKHEQRETQEAFVKAIFNQTVHGDVLDFLAGVPDDHVDLCLTSPPYNVNRNYGNANDSMHPLKYFGWMCQIVSELERVTKPGGIIAMNVGGTRDKEGRIQPLDWVLKDAFKETDLVYQNRTFWPTSHGLTPRRRQAERYESIMIYCKGGEPTVFNADPGRTPQKQFDKRAPNQGKATSHVLGAWPTDVWTDVKHVGHNHGEKVDHPAQFSEHLARKIIEMYTNAGMLVLDCFSGSGTTQKACIETLRGFIGADIFFDDVREERLAGVGPKTFCPFPGVTPESASFWAQELAPQRSPWKALARRVDYPSGMLFDEAEAS